MLARNPHAMRPMIGVVNERAGAAIPGWLETTADIETLGVRAALARRPG